MNKPFLFTTFLFFSLKTSANSFITYCWDNDCFKNGRTEYSTNATYIDYACREKNCHNMGQINGTFSNGSYTMCIDGDCRHNGYYEIKRSNQELIAKTECKAYDCTQFGAIIYSKEAIKELQCLDQNCLKSGHQIIQNGKIIEIVRCIENDCEHIGWKTFK